MAERKSNLKKNFDWYYANLRRLLPKYRGRVIAFADGDVIGTYDSDAAAVRGALALGYAPGTFAVHLCVPKKEEKPLWFTPLFPNGYEIKDVMVSGLNLSICDALVGMDIITRGDFHLTNDGNTVFKFSVPPEAKGSI